MKIIITFDHMVINAPSFLLGFGAGIGFVLLYVWWQS